MRYSIYKVQLFAASLRLVYLSTLASVCQELFSRTFEEFSRPAFGPNSSVFSAVPLGLLLCSKDKNCHVTGVELDERAHAEALENIRRNNLGTRMESLCADLRSLSGRFPSGSFSCCVSNPPYFSGGAVSRSLPAARQEGSCTPDDLFVCGSRLLKFGGDFFLVHKPERLAELITAASARNLEAKRLCLVRHRTDGPVALILLQLRKGGTPGLQLHEACLFDSQGEPTAYYREVYHM